MGSYLFGKQFEEADQEKKREREKTTSTNDQIVDLENIWEGVNMEVKLIRE